MKRLVLVLLALGGCSSPGDPSPEGLDASVGVALDGGPEEEDASEEDAGPVVVMRLPQRVPALPLVVRDPTLNVWSFSPLPTDDWPRLWTGATRPLGIAARIDAQPYRLLGLAPDGAPMQLTTIDLRPTRTSYTYSDGGVVIVLSFVTPIVPKDDEAMALPGVWMELSAASIDGNVHDLSFYVDADSSWVRGDTTQSRAWKLADGTTPKGVAFKRWVATPAEGTDLVYTEVGEYPEWGEFSLAAPVASGLSWQAGPPDDVHAQWLISGELTGDVDLNFHSYDDGPAAFAFAYHEPALDSVGTARRLFLAHGRAQAVQVDGADCIADWTAGSTGDLGAAVGRAFDGADGWRTTIEAHDTQLINEAAALFGPTYATLTTVAYRQTWGANQPCHVGKEPMVFQKELSSGGFANTLEVLFSSSPLFLYENPATLGRLLKASLEHEDKHPVGKAFPRHDLGPWPLVQDDPVFAVDTPVESTTDALILVAAYTLYSGDLKLATAYKKLLGGWADYLRSDDVRIEPKLGQISADDFEGELPGTTIFGLKVANAVEAWAKTLDKLKDNQAAVYHADAKKLFSDWVGKAGAGNHLALTYDGMGWSIKYNLFVDRLLGLGLASDSLIQQEVAYYRMQLGPYGAPLDSRFGFTKADWLSWAAMLTGDQSDFDALAGPIALMLEQTAEAAAFPDLFDIYTMQLPWAFSSRPVVGAVFGRLAMSKPH